MNRASLLGLTLLLPALGAAFFACQNDTKPPVSDGPGTFNPSQGSGSGGEGGVTADGGAGLFATFPGYTPSGVAAVGDSAYVTLFAIDTSQPGAIVRVDPDGTVTTLANDQTPSLPVTGPDAVFYARGTTSGSHIMEIVRFDLASADGGAQSLLSGVDSPSNMIVVGSNLFIASSAGGTGMEIDSVPVTGGPENPVTSLSGDFNPGELASDGVNIYFAASSTGAGGEIGFTPLAGAPADALVSTAPGSIDGLILNDGQLLYGVVSTTNNNAIFSVGVGGGAASPVVSGLASGVASFVVSNGSIYFADDLAEGTIARVPLQDDAGVDPEALVSANQPSLLTVGDDWIFAISADGLIRVPR